MRVIVLTQLGDSAVHDVSKEVPALPTLKSELTPKARVIRGGKEYPFANNQ